MNYKRFLIIIFSFLAVFCGNISYSLAQEAHNLTIIHTNDVHGRLKPVDYDNKQDVGGFAARAKLIKKIKSQNKNVLVLDAGDIAQGTLFFKFFDGIPDMKLMSEVGYDAAELGNHEFDKGISGIEKMVGSAKFPFLCANIRFLNNSELQKKVKPYIIKDYNGFKVAVIGIIANDLKTLVSNSRNIEVLDSIETTKNIVKEVNSKVDLIVVLSHSGFEEDIKVAKAVPEVDVIVGGHSHTFLKKPYQVFHGKTSTLRSGSENLKNGFHEKPGLEDLNSFTLIVQDGEFGINIGSLDLNFENKNIEKYNYDSILVDGTDKDSYFERKIAKLYQKIYLQSNQKIGEIKVSFEGEPSTRKQLNKYGALINQAIKEKCPEAEIVIINGGGIRSKKPWKAGTITLADVFEVYPFENLIVVADVKGSDIKSVLETSSRYFPESNAGLLQSLGLKYDVNVKEPPQVLSEDGLKIIKEGNKVSNIKINGKPLENDKYYKIAMNDFIFNGGNCYSQFNNAKNVKKTSIFVQNAIIDYIKKNSPVSVEVEDKINLY
ncbi:MAG: hypothetical protein A2039_08505 [Candidatus Melainabacteria bacterium GWA2_34_9]|nr:MAG: hypothetical protein A2039_08505 [Candidatus Melainabacteria bacterium GWA2_34_9]